MTKHTLSTLDPAAVAFFAEHAGTSYHPDRETPEEGTQRHARGLARAEAWLKADDDLRVDWEDDWEVDHVAEYPDAYDHEPDTCEQATLTNGNVDVLASLGCIDDATPEYRRVVEAELAQEAMPAELTCDCETPDTATCGTCGSTWCARCHPSPSDRCHFEYEHDDDDDDDDVTDAERIAYTLGKLRHWIENLDANAAHYQDDIARRATTARANDLRDVLAMLDGTDDAYIRQLRS